MHIVPKVSNDFTREELQFMGIIPVDGLNPTKLCHAAGILIEPAVSVPIDNGANPENTAVAAPIARTARSAF